MDGSPQHPQHPPAAAAERVEALDVIRGFAVLGILLMNILAAALPLRAYSDPTVDGATRGAGLAAFIAVELFANGVMRALFCLLFGVAIVLLTTGANALGAAAYYRRQALLLAFGLANAFVLLWAGDILVPYALAAMLLYGARQWRVRHLLLGAAGAFGYLLLLYGLAFGVLAGPESPERSELLAMLHSGVAMQDAWEAAKFGSGYGEAFAANARHVGELYVDALPGVVLWDVIACMMLGMALGKAGVLAGRRSGRFHAVLAVCGIGIGLAVNAWEVAMTLRSGYALQWVSGLPVPTADLGRVSMALGFAALLLLLCRRRRAAAPRWRAALAAAGRMALSNYLLQSLFALALFHDFGFGLWNVLPRHGLYGIVLLEWAAMLAFSVWWMRRFRFGPCEWLWRSLAGGSRLPMRRAA